MGASDEVIATEEITPSFAESWRTVHKIDSLKRLWWSLPFLATSLIGFVTLASLMYEQEFGLDERGRGIAAAVSEPFQLLGAGVGHHHIAHHQAGGRGKVAFAGHAEDLADVTARIGFGCRLLVAFLSAARVDVAGTDALVLL